MRRWDQRERPIAQDEARPVILYVAREHDRDEGGDHRRGPLEPGKRVIETQVRLIGSVPAARYVHDLKAQVLSHVRRERLLVRDRVADRDRLAGNDEREQLWIGCSRVARGAVAPGVDRVRGAPVLGAENGRARRQQHPPESRILTPE